jgi:4-coumarate--CoA ligase
MSLPLSAPAIDRILRSLLAAELGAMAGRRTVAASLADWPADLDFGEAGLGLDSLELMGCAAAANQFFQLHETGIEDYLLRDRRLDGWVAIVEAALREGTSGLTFTTSGSTGVPKPCPQPNATLLAEAEFWAAEFRGVTRILQAVPAHHIYGCLFTALLTDLLGVPVLDARARAPGVLARSLAPGDLLVGFPAGLQQMLRSLPGLPAGLRCTSSTAPLPAATHAALHAAGAAEVTEIYGSSETAGIGFRRDPAAPFALLPRWRPGAAGAAASVIERASGVEFPLPDLASWGGDGALTLHGRKDRAVQVGGINVYPEKVAARLAQHPLIAAAAVRLDATLAEPRLKAFIVPATGASAEAAVAALEAWCRAQLSAAERPVRIEAGPALPRGALDKPADWSQAA